VNVHTHRQKAFVNAHLEESTLGLPDNMFQGMTFLFIYHMASERKCDVAFKKKKNGSTLKILILSPRQAENSD